MCDQDGQRIVVGKRFIVAEDLSSKPVKSLQLGVLRVCNLSEFMTWHLKDIKC